MSTTFIWRMVATSIGRKFLMAASGLLLGAFMLVHLAENLLLFQGEVAYNTWVDLLLSNPLVPPLELGLAIIFLVHITTGIWVRLENWLNSPGPYESRKWQGGRTIGSATMSYTAFLILAYLAYHLLTFRFVDHSMGFYQMVTSAFRSGTFTAIYVAGAAALALHLTHGLQSAFQTLGVNHPKYTPIIKTGGILAALTMLGFALISAYFTLNLDIKADEATYQATMR